MQQGHTRCGLWLSALSPVSPSPPAASPSPPAAPPSPPAAPPSPPAAAAIFRSFSASCLPLRACTPARSGLATPACKRRSDYGVRLACFTLSSSTARWLCFRIVTHTRQLSPLHAWTACHAACQETRRRRTWRAPGACRSAPSAAAGSGAACAPTTRPRCPRCSRRSSRWRWSPGSCCAAQTPPRPRRPRSSPQSAGSCARGSSLAWNAHWSLLCVPLGGRKTSGQAACLQPSAGAATRRVRDWMLAVKAGTPGWSLLSPG